MRPDDVATSAEPGPDLGVEAGNRLSDWDRVEAREHVLDECTSARTRAASGAMHAVQELADGDDAYCAFLGAEELCELTRTFALPLDEEAGIDQDGQ